MKKEIHILFVEDVPADAVMVKHELRKAGLCFSTRRVDSKEDFLRELQSNRPDVILSDHGLPSFDGFTALALAREKCPDVPFIFVTESLGEQFAIKTFESGATDYVLKKELSKLGGAVQRALRDARKRVRMKEKEKILNEKLELRVVERTAQLQAANEELEAFSYSVSHDLRAPLRRIVGYAEILQSEAGALDDEARRHLQVIADSGRQMSELVDALLTFSRMGAVEMRLQNVTLAQVVKDAQHELHRELEGRDVIWRIGALPDVRGDPLLLRQVMVNLLSNALKYTRTRPQAKIEIGAQKDAQHTTIFVRDNGVGFDPAGANKLFGVFQRLHRVKEFEGNGIGLANVRRIINRHGGKTWAESAIDEGATFYFSLPAPAKGAVV